MLKALTTTLIALLGVSGFFSASQAQDAANEEENDCGTFQAPLYILQQNKEEPRPQEIFVTTPTATASFSPFALSGLPVYSSASWLGPLSFGGIGYPLSTPFSWTALRYSAFGSFGGYHPAIPFIRGIGGIGGFGGGLFNPGLPYAGFAGGFSPGFYSPGQAALMFGPSYNPFGLNRRMTTTTRVFQSGPSASSGNYYQPSTTSAGSSGGYYSSTGSTIIPVTPSEPLPKDYWGPSGNPFGN